MQLDFRARFCVVGIVITSIELSITLKKKNNIGKEIALIFFTTIKTKLGTKIILLTVESSTQSAKRITISGLVSGLSHKHTK